MWAPKFVKALFGWTGWTFLNPAQEIGRCILSFVTAPRHGTSSQNRSDMARAVRNIHTRFHRIEHAIKLYNAKCLHSDLCTSFKESWIRDGIVEKRSQQVGTKSFWRLVGHLDSCTLQTTITFNNHAILCYISLISGDITSVELWNFFPVFNILAVLWKSLFTIIMVASIKQEKLNEYLN